jgi:superfamily I DNA/RNA helicase
MINGVKNMMGMETEFPPSEQQQAVWDELMLSKGVNSIAMVAYNRDIAQVLKQRVPFGVQAMTIHAAGLRAVSRAFPFLRDKQANKYRTQNLLGSLFGMHSKELEAKRPTFVDAVAELVSLCKQTLCLESHDGSLADLDIYECLMGVATHFDIDLNGTNVDEVFDYVVRVFELSADPSLDEDFDFNDMVWLPVHLNLPVQQFNLLIVDEAQDLNRARQQLVLRSGERIVLVGDDQQAIYGFAGADSQSLDTMRVILNGGSLSEYAGVNCTDGRGCRVLPLTVTRRCGRAIVREAQRLVPDFEAHPSNHEGSISHANYETYHGEVQTGDFVLCRVNAPLVSQCFKFIKLGKKAVIQGRDEVGGTLIKLVKKLWKNGGIVEFIGKLDQWLDTETKKEKARQRPDEMRLSNLQDKHGCLLCFVDDLGIDGTCDQLIGRINAIFTDSKDNPGIKLSSLHKAKGLESENVFYLKPKGGECPHPMAKSAWEQEQERHLDYVGITRAIRRLIYVRQSPVR